ncbi:MAG: DUF4249 family protein [Lewinella sp.]
MLRFTALLVLSVSLLTCVDEIDLEQADSLPEGIVVRGRLVLADQAIVEINLEQLFQFASNLPDRIVTAEIILENTEGQQMEIAYRDGAYRTTFDPNGSDFSVRAGLGYRVLVTTREGARYGSEFDYLPERVVPDTVTTYPTVVLQENVLGVEEEVPALGYALTSPVTYPDGEPAYLRNTYVRDYALTQADDAFPLNPDRTKVCYLSESIGNNRVDIVSGRDLADDRVTDLPLFLDPINFKYAQGHLVTINQEAISQGAYQYFDQISRIGERSESIFANPPGPIVGNVTDLDGETINVFGYFYAANRAVTRVATTPAEVDNPRTFCPPPPNNGPGNPPILCVDCLNGPNAQLQAPEYWPF